MSASGVEIRGASKIFRSGRRSLTALSDIDLEIGQGEFITLFGPSGCGTSTLLRMIAGLEDASGGEVSVFGMSPEQASSRKNIAWIPQSSALLPWLDIRRNADLSRVVNSRADTRRLTSRSPEDPDALLAELGLGDFSTALPAALSGGMRQRASIARGFVQGAPLMLMDEPFSALDELTKDSLRLRLLELWERHRKTIVFVTHSAFEAALLSDRVVVMTPRPGRIQGIVEVGFPRPRTVELTESAAFAEKVTEIKHVLRSGWQEDQ